MNPILAVQDLYKSFHVYPNPMVRLRERILGGIHHHIHCALEDLNLRLMPGESLGILGQNGAGKSTLLKIVTGVLLPDRGEIARNGKITGLLELGAGFDYNLTGMENIRINGQLLGMSPAEIASRRDAIIAFAELGDYIDAPVKTYSSGMIMRLGFAIAIHAEPGCFVVDEALSVGDARFQQKCLRRIRNFQESGGSILFVSHDLNAIRLLCNRAIVLDYGRLVFEGAPEDAVNYYNKLIARLEDAPPKEPQEKNKVEAGYGLKEVRITAITMAGEQGQPNVFSTGETVTIQVFFESDIELEDTAVGFMIRDRFGQDIYGTNTHLMGEPQKIKKGQKYVQKFYLEMDISPGKYTLTAAIHTYETHLENCQHWWDNVFSFEIAGIRGHQFSGICRLPTMLYETSEKPAGATRPCARTVPAGS